MFDCDSINKDLKSRGYIYEIILLAAIILIGLTWLIYSKLYSISGTYAVVSCGYEDAIFYLPLSEDAYYTYYRVDDIARNDDFVGPFERYEDALSIKNMVKKYGVECEYNIIHIANNQIQVIEASCPDQICVNTKAASRTNHSIVCLPHKLVISIVSDDTYHIETESQNNEGDLDAVTW